MAIGGGRGWTGRVSWFRFRGRAERATLEGIASYQVLEEFFSVALERLAKPMSASEVERYLSTVLRPLLAEHSSPLYFEGLADRGQHRMSWYDSLIVAAALESHCERLYSQDCEHGRKIQDKRTENRLPDGRNPRSFFILLD
jgi:predicted nucleic acid-binding protein